MAAGVAQLKRTPAVPGCQAGGGVGQAQVLGKNVLPDIRRVDLLAARFPECNFGFERSHVARHKGRVGGEVGGGGGEWQQVDALDLARVVNPPGVVSHHAAKDLANLDVFVFRWQHFAVDVKPIVVDGLHLGGVEVDAQVAQSGIAVHLGPQNDAGPGVDGLGRRLLVVTHLAHADARGPGVALIRIKVAQKWKVGRTALRVGNVIQQQLDHAAPALVGGPGRVAQGDLGGSAYPVAIGEVVVVELFYGEELFRVASHRALPLVQVEIGAAFACKPLLGTPFHQGQQLVTRLQVALLFHHIHQLQNALQALALPVGALAFFEHHAARIAHIGLHHIAQLTAARPFGHARPIGHKAVVVCRRLELPGLQQMDGAADGVIGSAQFSCHRCVAKPLVRIQAQQRAVVSTFHGLGRRAEGGVDPAGLAVKGPLHAGVLHKRIGVAPEQGQRFWFAIGHGSGTDIALARGQVGNPLGVGHLLPAGTAGRKQGIVFAAQRQCQHLEIGASHHALGCLRQAQAQIAPAQGDLGIGHAMRHGNLHVIRAAAHRDAHRPIPGPGQLGRPGAKGHGRQQQGRAVRVLDHGIEALGRHHFFAWQGKLQSL